MTADTQGKKIFFVAVVLLTINVVDVQKFSLISKINATLFTFPVCSSAFLYICKKFAPSSVDRYLLGL